MVRQGLTDRRDGAGVGDERTLLLVEIEELGQPGVQGPCWAICIYGVGLARE